MPEDRPEDRAEERADDLAVPSHGDALQTVDDAALITRVREGDVAAYEVLYLRHRDVALRYARRIAGRSRADDLSSEAFAKILDLLQRGKGPHVAFRAYLLTTVRTCHLNTVRAGRREVLVPEHEPLGNRISPVVDDPDGRFDRAAITRAFDQLPERWRAALWLTAVEGFSNEEVADRLGIKPNAVASLAFRARGGLRQAFLDQHLLDVADPTCQSVLGLLPAQLRGSATPRRRAEVDAHLDVCPGCSLAALELADVDSRLGALLAPLGVATVLGSGAAAPAASTGLLSTLKSALTAGIGQVNSWWAGVPAATGAKVAVSATAAAVGLSVGAHTLHHDRPPAPTDTGTVLVAPEAAPVQQPAGTRRPQRRTPPVGVTPTPTATTATTTADLPTPTATSAPAASAPPPDTRTGPRARTMSVGKVQTSTFERDGQTWNLVSIPVYHPARSAVVNLTASRTRTAQPAASASADWSCHPPILAFVDGLLLHTVNTTCVYKGDGAATFLQMEYAVGTASRLTAALIPPLGYLDLSGLDNIAHLRLLT